MTSPNPCVTQDSGSESNQWPVDLDDPEAVARWIDTEVLPIPEAPPPPLSFIRGQGASGWPSFRAPYPPVPVWNPGGPKRLGLQAGHWKYDEAPEDLAELRNNPGTSGGGKAEWEVNLDLAERAVAPGVPQAILEIGFLTNWSDRQLLLGNPDRAALGIANGVLRYLGMKTLTE